MSNWFTDGDLPEGLRDVFARSSVSLTLADLSLEDSPLVGVNQKFCELSGYLPQDILGRNCRFLQPEGGAGPVRARMSAFLETAGAGDGRFLVPNVTKRGERFLNLLYMSKLSTRGQARYVLGSQFAFQDATALDPDLYDRALKEDLRQINRLTDRHNLALLGNYETLASSHSIIARSRIE
ncbi:PAS domain-containing protein [Aurantiacibacter aquimixticola]|uniref:PAS domain-containing protein n=1 Tax=Aurantiacibacter aquimixticola TaxID=1958945 RepID=A0A419RTV3_9SPHN|nr:PAS domain-containing protein [Aurantiacibacter aquimixticola]RJY09215.1 PAS domain-containing protein [Aurantiacibacter aquimixticola]